MDSDDRQVINFANLLNSYYESSEKITPYDGNACR